ncbi:hypothetical protein JX266_014338, partial [Neoarthrinium moseri]
MSNVSVITVPEKQLHRCQLELDKAEARVYTLLSSKGHWEVITYRVYQCTVSELPGKTFTVCATSSWPCCNSVPEKTDLEGRGSKFFKNFSSGSWVNAGHTYREPELAPNTTCKERRDSALRSLIEKDKAILPNTQTQEIQPESLASTAIRALERGMKMLVVESDLDNRDISTYLKVIQADYRLKRDLEALADDIGGAALVIFAAAAVSGFKFNDARDVGYINLARDIRQGILRNDVPIACGIKMFNPALVLSEFLQENYEDLCEELGLENLSKLHSMNGKGVFWESTLAEVMAKIPSSRVEEPLPDTSLWIIRGSHNAGSANKQAGTIMGKRKRTDDIINHGDRATQVRHDDTHLEPDAPRVAKQVANYDSLASHVRLTSSDTDTLAEDDAATDHSCNHGDAGASVRREGPSAEQVRPGMPPCASGSSAPSTIPNHETMTASVPQIYSESVNVGDRGSDVPTVATSNTFTRPKSPMGDNGDWNLDGFLSTLSTQISPADMNMFDLGVGDLM